MHLNCFYKPEGLEDPDNDKIFNRNLSKPQIDCLNAFRGKEDYPGALKYLASTLPSPHAESNHDDFHFDYGKAGLCQTALIRLQIIDTTRDAEVATLPVILRLLQGVVKAEVKFRPGASTVKELYAVWPQRNFLITTAKIPLTEDIQWEA